MNKPINQLVFRSFLMALCISAAAAAAFAQSTAFTYQGRLQDGGTNANGSYDLQFTLWDSLAGGTQQPQPGPITVIKSSVAVVNGVFTLQLDFGATAFPGADRFLETSVRPAGSGAFTLLAPRQQVTSTPYAIRSASAASADNVPVGAIPAGSGNYIQNSSAQQPTSNFNISGNGSAGGTLSANSVNSSTTFNIAGNRVVSVTGDTIFPTSNTLVGVGAGTKILPNANGDGGFNSFYGFDAGFFNTTGKANSFFGSSAGQSNTTGVSNSFFGLQAGYGNTTGANNSFFGFSAGFNSTTGHDNSIFGTNAGLNQSGNYNTYIGGQAGQTTSGDTNTFIGFNTGVQGQSASNTLLGYSASLGSANLTNATAIGAGAIVSKSNSLVLGATGTNVGVGTVSPSARLHVVGDTNLVGNVTISGSLKADNINGVRLMSAGTQNLFAGDLAGQSNTGQQNSFFGYFSGAFNTTGNFNSFFGVQTGFANTTGSSNSFFGTAAGSGNTTGNFNAFFGLSSGLKNTVGSDNSFFGPQAGQNNVDGNFNSFVGRAAGGQNTSGGANTFLGWAAGDVNSTGSENTILGFNADVASNNLTNATAIGARASVSQNNSLVLGSISGVNNALASTNVGIGTTAPSARLHVVGDTNLVGNLTVSGTLNATLPTNSSSYIQNTSSQQASSNFNISGNGTVGTNLIASGKIGIGTASPAVKLDINDQATSVMIRLQGPAAGGSEIDFIGSGGTMVGAVGNAPGIASGTPATYLLGSSGTAVSLGAGGSMPPVFNVMPNQNVGIGTTAPTFKLHVNGETRTDIMSIGTYVANNGGPALCANTSNNRIALCTSSLRYKTNVVSFQHGLDIIQRLRPISFTWREGGMSDIGLGAEEVDKVEPLLTFRNNQGEIEGVRYNQLSAVFINAFKEQQAQIAQQQKQLKAQAEEIKRQEQQAGQQQSAFAAQQRELDALKKLVCRTHARAAACRR